jgi:hypothetical protein
VQYNLQQGQPSSPSEIQQVGSSPQEIPQAPQSMFGGPRVRMPENTDAGTGYAHQGGGSMGDQYSISASTGGTATSDPYASTGGGGGGGGPPIKGAGWGAIAQAIANASRRDKGRQIPGNPQGTGSSGQGGMNIPNDYRALAAFLESYNRGGLGRGF